MSRKNETLVLILSLLVTVGLIAGGFWWFSRNSKFGLNQILSNQSLAPNSPSGKKDFTAVQDVPTGLFNYGGSTSWAPIRLFVDSAITSAKRDFRLRYVEPNNATPGSTTGIQALIDGQLAFAQSSRPLTDQELNRAKQRGFSLNQISVAIDGLAVAVNPQLNIPGLTLEQLKSIYTGKITNWRQVGGPNLPIRPYSRRVSDGGTVELFVQDILGGQTFGNQVEFVSTTTQALRKVAASPGGIYYASAPEVVPQCSIKPLPLGRTSGQYIAPYQEPFILPNECPGKRNKLNIEVFQSGKYPITRNLFVVVKQNGQNEEKAGIAYANFLLTDQGQELIAQSGFVRIR
ncbi:MAG TPA: PstS family phosphate ABC transporter substrate-binding protein [Nostocaceae cyanobacterium]|nr:PstS family phosphate ABC transporter substrate-binding protein [Nostocaceae cyanobacterium]